MSRETYVILGLIVIASFIFWSGFGVGYWWCHQKKKD